MAKAVPAEGRRRTQAERRETTRAALLDAALECLIEDGYANLTTRRVAERAGVSQGTQMHYFPTRAQFVAEAVRHVALRLAREAGDQPALRARGERQRLEALLDQVWELHRGPLFQATMELWVGARADPEARQILRETARDLTKMLRQGTVELFPEMSAKRGSDELFDTTLAAVRGLAMMSSIGEPEDTERRWRATRGHILALYDAL